MGVAQKCAAVVVGAGPAGLAVIGNLLERQVGKVAWIDPRFQGGRVNRKYREVPRLVCCLLVCWDLADSLSNTKVALFNAYATSVQPFRTVIRNTPSPSPFTTLEKLDENETCHLHHAADMVRAITEGVAKMDQVYPCRGSVTAANLAESVSLLFRLQTHTNHSDINMDRQHQTPKLQTER